MNVQVCNLLLRVNEARFLVQHESCKCKCGFNESLCNSNQKQNHDECRCECKKLDDWRFYKDDYTWNPSTCDCKGNKACKTGEYLDIKNCSCKKRLIGKLVLSCECEVLNATETILDNKIAIRENNCLMCTMSLVITCTLLLVVVPIVCHYYYTRYWKNQKH